VALVALAMALEEMVVGPAVAVVADGVLLVDKVPLLLVFLVLEVLVVKLST
jgi:hypothetical protein